MVILIDRAVWPAHGSLWSHLVSDSNLAELHDFARQLKVPRRGFDLDHYDVPESLYERALSLGAKPVAGKELFYALEKSGLRVRQIDKPAQKVLNRKQYLRDEWERLFYLLDPTVSAGSKLSQAKWLSLGEDLTQRWQQKNRFYHNEKHLEDILLALNLLETHGEEITPETLTAAWFHDAVYEGVAGRDEKDSADYAEHATASLGLPKGFQVVVKELILATDPNSKISGPEFAHLLDSDTWIFAAGKDRYREYTLDVRAEYSHVNENDFRLGRSKILRNYLDKPSLYQSTPAKKNWEPRARENLQNEITLLSQDKR